MNRPSWEETRMHEAVNIAARSTCLKYKVGAIFVRENRILSEGYNGPPKGLKHCHELGGCQKEKSKEKRCRGVHAEMNAVVNAAFNGISLAGSDLYCTYSPCLECVKHLINLGVSRIVFKHHYEKEPEALEMLKEAGIAFVMFSPGPEDL